MLKSKNQVNLFVNDSYNSFVSLSFFRKYIGDYVPKYVEIKDFSFYIGKCIWTYL